MGEGSEKDNNRANKGTNCECTVVSIGIMDITSFDNNYNRRDLDDYCASCICLADRSSLLGDFV